MKKFLLVLNIVIIVFYASFQNAVSNDNYDFDNLDPGNGNYVVFLHGMARSSSSFNKMEAVYKSLGYNTLNFDYSSTDYSIDYLVENEVRPFLEKNLVYESRKVFIVTHSLGGIVIRYYLKKYEIPNLDSVVMLAPPNKGSYVTEKLKWIPLYETINGPAGMELGTETDSSTPLRIGPVNYPAGIIAGDRSLNIFLSLLIDGPNDGKVSIEQTKVEGMTDHIVVHRTHPMIMRADEVIFQTAYFFQNHHFKR